MGYNTACSTIALVKPNRVKLLKHDPGMQDYENCLVIDALYGIMFFNFSDCPVFFLVLNYICFVGLGSKHTRCVQSFLLMQLSPWQCCYILFVPIIRRSQEIEHS